MQPAPMAQPMPGVPPAVRKTSPIVWILVVVLGLFVLGFIGVVGTGFFIARTAMRAGLDPDLMKRNPGLAMAKLITSVNPDTEVVRTDEGAGTITVRDRKTGKITTMTFDDVKTGKFNMKVQDENGQTATVEVGGATGKLPSWVPEYPGSTATGTFAIKGSSNDGSGEGGNVTFSTTDAPQKVMSFYQDKAKDLGMKANLTTNSPDGGMFIATDEDNRRTLTVVVGKGSPDTTVNITYGVKK
jgi:hypothetical protein